MATQRHRERAQQYHYTTCFVWSALHSPPHHQAHQQWSTFVCAVMELVVLLLLLLKTAQEEEQEQERESVVLCDCGQS